MLSFHFSNKQSKSSTLVNFSFLLCMMVILGFMGCSETSVNTDKTWSAPDEVEVRSSNDITPHSVLSAIRTGKGLNFTAKSEVNGGPKASSDGFASPLFGLATAPNGDILVADAGAGVSTLDGTNEIPLPGITDIAPIGRSSVWALQGLTGAPGEDKGQGLYLASKGHKLLLVDLYDYEVENNPDGAELIDSNPFDIHSLGGEAALVADAGGNDLLRVDNQGNIDLLAVFPDEPVPTDNIKNLVGCPESEVPLCELPPELPAQPVSTSIAVGPDGYYYVGELKGFPAPTGESNIWRIAPGASAAMCGSSPDCEKVFDGGFTSIIDLAFYNGNLYVAELDEQSWFAVEIFGPDALAGGTINKCDLSMNSCEEVATGIPILTAINFGKDGSLWATENALIPDLADVIKIK